MDIRGMQPRNGTPAFYEPFNLGQFKIFNPDQVITRIIVIGKTVTVKKVWNGRKFKLKQEVR
jgi:hypothetical protein